MKKALLAVAALLVLIVVQHTFCNAPQITNPNPIGTSIVCFGDSLTFGTGAGAGESYPSKLSSLIGSEVINAGVPGDTTTDGLKRLDRDVLSHDPRIVLITLGGNDLMREVPREQAFENLETIVRRIHSKGALVVVGGIDVPLFDRGYDQAYEDLQRSTGCLLIPNVLKGLFGRNDLMSDQIHPNGNGYAIMAQRFQEKIKPYL